LRAALILPSQFPNGPKLAAAGVDTTYHLVAEPGQQALTATALDERRKFWRVGIDRDSSWTVNRDTFNGMTAEKKVEWAKAFAKLLSDDLVRLASPSFFSKDGPPKQCFVMADIEYQSNLFLVEFLKEWRRLRTARFTVLTVESMQGGWWEPDLVQLVNADPNLVIAKQNYEGDMDKLDGWVTARDLIRRGVNPEKITSFHSCRQPVEGWWDGCLFLENWEQLA
jgi:hypothetical protein